MSETYTVSALTPMRRAIAARMTLSVQSIPHFRMRAQGRADALDELRANLRQLRGKDAPSINDLLLKVTAMALIDTPEVNLQWSDEGIRSYRSVDLSVVMATEGGLVTPVIRAANEKSVFEIATEVRGFAARAKAKALKMHEIEGGSFSVSNLGMYGVEEFDAIINPPQCAILALGAIRQEVIVSQAGSVSVGKVISATLACDHRAIDGVGAAKFLAVWRTHLEHASTIIHGGGT